MNTPHLLKKTAVSLAVLVLAGCASVNINESVDQTNQELNGFTNGNLSLVQTDEQRQAMASKASEILKEPLSQPAAVELMLTHSPQFQTVLAENWAQAAQAAQSAVQRPEIRAVPANRAPVQQAVLQSHPRQRARCLTQPRGFLFPAG